MGLTNAELRREVRALLNERTEGFWLDSQLDSWIAQAATDVSTKSDCIECHAALVVLADQIAYPAPATFRNPVPLGTVRLTKVHAVLLGGRALVKIHPQALGHLIGANDADEPQHYAHFGTTLYIAPAGITSAGEVTLLCSITSDDAQDLPDAWQLLVIPYAASRGLLQSDRHAEASLLYSEYINSLTYQINFLLKRGVTSRAELTVPDDVRVP